MTHYGTVQTVKLETNASVETLNVDSEQALDDYIKAELEVASSEIDRYCNRTFRLVENHVDTIRGTNLTTIQLNNSPVQTIHSVEENGSELTEGEDFKLKKRSNFDGENNGILEKLTGGEPSPYARWHATVYTIEYDWGYSDVDIPKVLNSVAEDLVAAGVSNAIAQNSATEKGGASSISMDGFSVSYDISESVTDAQITAEQLNRLKSLREPRIV